MAEHKDILQTWVLIGAEHHVVDTIEHAGKLWLVPEWLDWQAEGWSRPVRIILLETLDHSWIAAGNPDFLVKYSIPKAVFEGRTPPESGDGVVVIELPEIYVSLPGGR